MNCKNKKIVVVIPARAGSKRIIDKNICNFMGKPLIQWTIDQAISLKKENIIDRVVVSTDSDIYSVLASRLGAEVVKRPAEISRDESLDIECFQHVLKALENENYFPDVFIHLRPTYPLRKLSDIKNSLKMFLNHEKASSLRSVVPSAHPVWKKYFKCWDGSIVSCIPTGQEHYNMPQQYLDPDFWHNGCIDIVKADIVKLGSMSGNFILPYFMSEEETKDIDEPCDLESFQFEKEFIDLPKEKAFCIDIDGIICTIVEDCNYINALPISSGIMLVNKLYENNFITLFTARGTLTGKDWTECTKSQLNKWGVKYHELRFGKPAANYYIDDKFVNIDLLKRRILGKETNSEK